MLVSEAAEGMRKLMQAQDTAAEFDARLRALGLTAGMTTAEFHELCRKLRGAS